MADVTVSVRVLTEESKMGVTKELLYDELKLKLALIVEGVSYDESIFQGVLLNNENLLKKVYCTWDKDLPTTKSYRIPYGFVLNRSGFGVGLIADKNSPYRIVERDGAFSVLYRGDKVTDITFPEPPAFYSKRTRDGVSMSDIAMDSAIGSNDRSLVVAYSIDCSVKDQGETCLFCVMNGTKKLDHGEERPAWKYPHQIAETVKAAYDEGFTHLTITGGFVPERREVEYYLDVAEHIRDSLGTSEFNGTACIGAPLDFSIIDKYKEAGYSTIAFNTEVWRKEYFDIFCPGKVTQCGGYGNWIKAIEYAVGVFGKGKVRSNFVVGLQPKDVVLEGIEYLASIGVVTVASSWVPGLGSPLEGHRSPTVDWHWDVQLRNAQVLKKYGRTYEEIFNATPARTITHDIYAIENGSLPAFTSQTEPRQGHKPRGIPLQGDSSVV